MALMSEQLRKISVEELGGAQTWPGVTRQETFATPEHVVWNGSHTLGRRVRLAPSR